MLNVDELNQHFSINIDKIFVWLTIQHANLQNDTNMPSPQLEPILKDFKNSYDPVLMSEDNVRKFEQLDLALSNFIEYVQQQKTLLTDEMHHLTHRINGVRHYLQTVARSHDS